MVYKSERLRWVNADTLTHVIVADSPDATNLRKTDGGVHSGTGEFVTRLLTLTVRYDVVGQHMRKVPCP